MKIHMKVSGVTGSPINSAKVVVTPVRDITIESFLSEFNIELEKGGDTRVFVEALPLPEEEHLEVFKTPFRDHPMLYLEEFKRKTYRSEINSSHKGRISLSEAKEILSQRYPEMPIRRQGEFREGDYPHHTGPSFFMPDGLPPRIGFWGRYEDGEKMGLSLPGFKYQVRGRVDINRILIPGKTKYGMISPTHLISERVESGLEGWIFGSTKKEDSLLSLYHPSASASRPGEGGQQPTGSAVILHRANTAFDLTP